MEILQQSPKQTPSSNSGKRKRRTRLLSLPTKRIRNRKGEGVTSPFPLKSRTKLPEQQKPQSEIIMPAAINKRGRVSHISCQVKEKMRRSQSDNYFPQPRVTNFPFFRDQRRPSLPSVLPMGPFRGCPSTCVTSCLKGRSNKLFFPQNKGFLRFIFFTHKKIQFSK